MDGSAREDAPSVSRYISPVNTKDSEKKIILGKIIVVLAAT